MRVACVVSAAAATIALTALFLPSTLALVTLSESSRAKLSDFIREVMTCRNVPGLAIGIVHDDAVLLQDGFGVLDVDSKTPVTKNSRFCIGSLTKSFTSTLLAHLLSRNRNITWDTPLKDILGDDFRLSDDIRTHYTNLRDILAHKLGVPGYFGGFLTGFNWTRAELVRRLRYFAPTAPFRTRYMYNNYMYLLAGYVSEKIASSSQTWEDLVKERILKPLNLTSVTFVDVDDHNWTDFALPHVQVNGTAVPIDPDVVRNVYPGGPAGSICSDIVDMNKWLMYHLDSRRTATARSIADYDVLHETHTEQFNIPLESQSTFSGRPMFPVAVTRFAYNFGWTTGTYRGYKRVYHGGNIFGYDSQMWMLTDMKLGFIVAVNGPNDEDAVIAIETILYYAVDLLLDEAPWLNLTTLCSFPHPWINNGHVSGHDDGMTIQKHEAPPSEAEENNEHSLSEYVGTYGHYALGYVHITIISDPSKNQSQLHLKHGTHGTAYLAREGKTNVFRATFYGSLWFVSNSSQAQNTYVQFNFKNEGDTVTELKVPWMSPGVTPIPTFVKDLNVDNIPDSAAHFQLLLTHSQILIILLIICYISIYDS